MMVQSIDARRIHWLVCRMKPLKNANRRTARIGCDFEPYKNRAGLTCYRPVKGSGQEVNVHELILRKNGFEVFLPVRKEWRRVSRYSPEKVLRMYPKLGGWMFVGLDDLGCRLQDLAALDLVDRVLGAAGHPVVISEAKVIDLMRRWGGGTLAPEQHRYMRTHAEFEVGDTVRVVEGSLEGFEFEVTGIDGPFAEGFVSLFGRETAFRLRCQDLEFERARPQNV